MGFLELGYGFTLLAFLSAFLVRLCSGGESEKDSLTCTYYNR